MKMIKTRVWGIWVVFLLVVVLGIGIASAALTIDGFTCPKDVAKDAGSFECTVTIGNAEGDSVTLNHVYLHPNSPTWLKLDGGNPIHSLGPGTTTDKSISVKFSGLEAISAGSNKGFSQINLDDPAYTDEAITNTKVNVIDLIVTTSNSASSAASGASFTTSPNVIVYGDGSVTLSLSIDSGGCSIGSQASQKTTTITSNTNQQTWSPVTWTITEGSSGDCKFTLTAAITGANGAATKTATTSQTVTCTNCTVTATVIPGTGSGGGGGGGGGASATVITPVTELTKSITTELGKDELFGFSFGNENHTLTVLDVTETTATVKIESQPQTFTLYVGEEKQVDLDADNIMDISLRLKSINLITKKATFVISPLYLPEKGKEAGKGKGEGGAGEGTGGLLKENKSYILIVLIALAAIALIIVSIRLALKAKRENRGAS